MNKSEFLKRCETIWELGLTDNLAMLRSATEVFTRLRYIFKIHPEYFDLIKTDTQGNIALNELTGCGVDMNDFRFGDLANDSSYRLVRLACILAHPCQKCGEDKYATHTIYGFCRHKKEME